MSTGDDDGNQNQGDATDMKGRLEAIWLKRARGGPMDAADAAELVEGEGIRGNADRGGWRQVTIIEKEIFDRLRSELGVSLEPAARRANLMVSGIDLRDSRDRVLRVGSSAIRIRGETKPCEQMDEAWQGLRNALRDDWLGGAFGIVVEGGSIRIGDPVTLEEAVVPQEEPTEAS